MAKSRNVDPALAHDRAVKAAKSRTGPDYHLRKLTEAAPTLTEVQKHRLAALVLLVAGWHGPGAGGEAA
jgi:hypothetical protein